MSRDPKRIAIPIAEINSDFRTLPFETIPEAAQKAKLNIKPPTCFDGFALLDRKLYI